MPRWITTDIEDGFLTVAETAKRLDVSTTHVYRLLRDGESPPLEEHKSEHGLVLVSEKSIQRYELSKLSPRDQRLMVIVKDGFLTPRQVADFAGVDVSVVYARCNGIETADGFKVFSCDEASLLRMRYANR